MPSSNTKPKYPPPPKLPFLPKIPNLKPTKHLVSINVSQLKVSGKGFALKFYCVVIRWLETDFIKQNNNEDCKHRSKFY